MRFQLPREGIQRIHLPLIRALIVDDDVDLLDLLGETLCAAGAQVRSASTVAEGLGLLASFLPTVIVTDIHLSTAERQP